MSQATPWPDDDDGDALRRLEAHSDDFSIPRDINFSVVFADRTSAKLFVAQVLQLGYQAELQSGAANPDTEDVNVVKHMRPSYAAIRDFEALLLRNAEPLGGFNDGWGCFAQTKESLT